MFAKLSGKVWVGIFVFLVLIIITAGTVVLIKFPRTQPVEISISPETTQPTIQGKINISGAVTNPGSYEIKAGDTLDDILQTAGTSTNADLERLSMYIPQTGEITTIQKVDINHAESWLLEALPGIGETLAGRIIAYRLQNGPFLNINELTSVEGISLTTYEKLKDLVVVGN